MKLINPQSAEKDDRPLIIYYIPTVIYYPNYLDRIAIDK